MNLLPRHLLKFHSTNQFTELQTEPHTHEYKHRIWETKLTNDTSSRAKRPLHSVCTIKECYNCLRMLAATMLYFSQTLHAMVGFKLSQVLTSYITSLEVSSRHLTFSAYTWCASSPSAINFSPSSPAPAYTDHGHHLVKLCRLGCTDCLHFVDPGCDGQNLLGSCP